MNKKRLLELAGITETNDREDIVRALVQEMLNYIRDLHPKIRRDFADVEDPTTYYEHNTAFEVADTIHDHLPEMLEGTGIMDAVSKKLKQRARRMEIAQKRQRRD